MIYSIPPSRPFLETLAQYILATAAETSASLNDIQVFLPTRRACRALQETFLTLSNGKSLLLPSLYALGDFEVTEALSLPKAPIFLEMLSDIPDAISLLERQAILTQLILKYGETLRRSDVEENDQRLGQVVLATQLAGDLASLIDQVALEDLNFDQLSGLVREEYARHWQITLDFLSIITEHWPQILKERQQVDPATRQRLLFETLSKHWQDHPPESPIIAAGSTGSQKATATLLSTISNLPKGSLILPGLDQHLSEEAWEALDLSHPQYGLSQLLKKCDCPRRDVQRLGYPSLPEREALISATLSPTLKTWEINPEKTAKALQEVTLIACATAGEEALAIALHLRECLETPSQTAALITPDRTLAKRVAAELTRWNIQVDDSAGQPLKETPAGTFFLLLAEWLGAQTDPVKLLSLLKHPLACGGIDKSAFRRSVRSFEKSHLRCAPSSDAFKAWHRTLDELFPWVGQTREIAFEEEGACALGELINLHLRLAEDLAETDSKTGADVLWHMDDGRTLAAFFRDIVQVASHFPAVRIQDYPLLLTELMSPLSVRKTWGMDPRVSIWGPLEARMQSADMVILGGMNEGTWPPEPSTDPWLSRPMRKEFGLTGSEKRLGLSAHDFTQAFCRPRVVITRAHRHNGVPTVPSRWLMRLESMLQKAKLEETHLDGTLAWQNLLDAPAVIQPCTRPIPTPPLEARPRKLSVTQVETLMRNPYATYARHILNLKPLEELEESLEPSHRGTLVHDVLEKFVQGEDKTAARFLSIAEEIFAPFAQEADVRFWWPRLERIANWVAKTEQDRKRLIQKSLTEVTGKKVYALSTGPFTLTAKADRVDVLWDRSVTLIDYKTGGTPLKKDIETGFSPQLPLEAALIINGGFEGIPAATRLESLEFWQLQGGVPPAQRIILKASPQTLAQESDAGVWMLLNAFENPAIGYAATPRLSSALVYNDYEHLERLREWSSAGASDGEVCI